MGRLTQWIEGKEALCQHDAFGRRFERQEPVKYGSHQVAEPASLAGKPVLKHRVTNGPVGEEFPLV